MFPSSARPRTSPARNEDIPLTKPTTPQRRKPLSGEGSVNQADDGRVEEQGEDSQLVYVIWDLTVVPLCDNPKVYRVCFKVLVHFEHTFQVMLLLPW